jgi:hypothetical protein
MADGAHSWLETGTELAACLHLQGDNNIGDAIALNGIPLARADPLALLAAQNNPAPIDWQGGHATLQYVYHCGWCSTGADELWSGGRSVDRWFPQEISRQTAIRTAGYGSACQQMQLSRGRTEGKQQGMGVLAGMMRPCSTSTTVGGADELPLLVHQN